MNLLAAYAPMNPVLRDDTQLMVQQLLSPPTTTPAHQIELDEKDSPFMSGLGGAIGGAASGVVPCAPLGACGPIAFGACVAAWSTAGAVYARTHDTTFDDGTTAAVNGLVCSAVALVGGTSLGGAVDAPEIGFLLGWVGSWFAGAYCAMQSREGHSPVGDGGNAFIKK